LLFPDEPVRVIERLGFADQTNVSDTT
jgi:hypothetical protein